MQQEKFMATYKIELLKLCSMLRQFVRHVLSTGETKLMTLYLNGLIWTLNS